MTMISIIIPIWSLVVIPISIIGLCGGMLLITSAFSKDSIWKSFVIPFLIIAFCATSLFVWHFYNKEPKQLNFATPDSLTSPVLRNMDIRISDLVREDFTIRNKTFENCRIYGPAIITLTSGNVISHNKFMEVDIEGTFIVTTNNAILNAIALEGCIITNCTLHKISFIGNSEQIGLIKKDAIFIK